MRRPTWEHGTIRGYEVCGGGGSGACDRCRHAKSTRGKVHRLLGDKNPNILVAAARAQQALELLQARGLSDLAISRLVGISHSNVVRIRTGSARWVRRDTLDRILTAVRYQHTRPTAGLRDGSRIPAARSHQQMRSLAALGWSLNWQREQLGVGHDVGRMVHRLITAEIAARIQALYDQYGGTPGPSKTAATMARKQGWHVPLAYDDAGRLIPGAVRNDLSRQAERREDRRVRAQLVEELTAQNLSAAEIAARLGVSDRTVTRARSRRSA